VKTKAWDRKSAERFMGIALSEARRGTGRTSPNPAVGAVVVKSGRVVSRGYHRRAGAPHAEVVAIERAGARARGSDLYVTLEPCDHYGRTPPCSLAILRAGIRRVICASSDPFPLARGRGIARLRRAGVPVLTGVLREEADRINRPYFKYIRTGLPWVTLKAAITLDGKIATASGDSRWVSSKKSRASLHQLRDQVDAILIGANTARQDNPQLTTRLPGGGGRDPVRVVLDSRLQLPRSLRVFRSGSKSKTILATLRSTRARKAKALSILGVEVWSVEPRFNQVWLRELMSRLAKSGLLHVMAEGGSQVFASLIRERLADELVLFIAPKLVGGGGISWTGDLRTDRMAKALKLKQLSIEPSGEDVLLRSLLPWAR
jgi:diaminohydroxyphosphoribosylaminopyrimidine deaminase/5-amino-6-(5-phosphoribosylamino)uracil reductase